MTNFRAFFSALACGSLSLIIGINAVAEEFSYTLNPDSHQSDVDNACVGALIGILQQDCTYNQANSFANAGDIPEWNTSQGWSGPVRGSNYFRPGDSPFQRFQASVQPPTPDPNSAELDVTGLLIIEDNGNGRCDGDDEISARLTLEEGTRSFAGGPGTFGEETWGENTITYVIPAGSTPDFQNVLGDGSCEYIFGSQGFPELLETLGGETYPADADILLSDATPDFGSGEDVWLESSNPSGIGVAFFEGPAFAGNDGLTVSIDPDVFAAGSYSCADNTAPTTPAVGDDCAGADATSGVCGTAGSNFCGTQGTQEDWIMRIVVDPTQINVSGQIFANNLSQVTNIAPAPPFNSWDGPLITFSAKTASVAVDDSYTFVTDTPDPLVLDVGANDDPQGIAGDTFLAVNPAATAGTTNVINNDGPINDIQIEYTQDDNSAPFSDTFSYDIDDGSLQPEDGLVATVVIDVVQDEAPVAAAYAIDLDTRGISPSTLSDATDITGVAGVSVGNEPTVTVDTQSTATIGTVSVNGTTITYRPGGSFFQGMDTFTYTITDSNFDSPSEETSDTVTVTVNIPNAPGLPTIQSINELTELEAGETVGFSSVVELGNGSADEHTGGGRCDNGNGRITLSEITEDSGIFTAHYTFRAPNRFNGDISCQFWLTDADGDGESAFGTVAFAVAYLFLFPGSGNALSPWSLLILLFLPLVRSRLVSGNGILNPGVRS